MNRWKIAALTVVGSMLLAAGFIAFVSPIHNQMATGWSEATSA